MVEDEIEAEVAEAEIEAAVAEAETEAEVDEDEKEVAVADVEEEVEEEWMEGENFFADETEENIDANTEEHIVTKTEHIGGVEHEGDIDFEYLYGEGEIPTDADFEPINSTPVDEENYDDFEESMVDYENFEGDTTLDKFIGLEGHLEERESAPIDIDAEEFTTGGILGAEIEVEPSWMD